MLKIVLLVNEIVKESLVRNIYVRDSYVCDTEGGNGLILSSQNTYDQ